MTLDEIMTTVRQSARDDWRMISCWGGGSGPSYLDRFDEVSGGGEPTRMMLAGSMPMRASYRRDLTIGIAWGYEYTDNFRETWANDFPDERAAGNLLDVFYNGMLVERVHYVVVDGGRALLPIPDRNEADDGTITWSVSPDKADLIRVLDEMESQPGNFDHYLSRAGITIVG